MSDCECRVRMANALARSRGCCFCASLDCVPVLSCTPVCLATGQQAFSPVQYVCISGLSDDCCVSSKTKSYTRIQMVQRLVTRFSCQYAVRDAGLSNAKPPHR